MKYLSLNSSIAKILQVKAFTSLQRTRATCQLDNNNINNCGDAAIRNDGLIDQGKVNSNTVEGRNLEFIRRFLNVTAPNCM